MIEEALYALLAADAGVAAAIQGGIWPVLMPEQASYPALSYFCVDSPQVMLLNQANALIHPRFQITAWSNCYLDSKRAALAVRAALDGFKGNVATPDGTVIIREIRFEDEHDTYEHQTRTFATYSDYFIWYQIN